MWQHARQAARKSLDAGCVCLDANDVHQAESLRCHDRDHIGQRALSRKKSTPPRLSSQCLWDSYQQRQQFILAARPMQAHRLALLLSSLRRLGYYLHIEVVSDLGDVSSKDRATQGGKMCSLRRRERRRTHGLYQFGNIYLFTAPSDVDTRVGR